MTEDTGVFELWKEYERVAMHFNDLLMRLRSQSLAAVGALAGAAGFAVKGDVTNTVRWGALSAAFSALTVFWVAIWILDFTYYNRLLTGAVNALLALEKHSAKAKTVDAIELSTIVETAVTDGKPSNSKGSFSRAFGRWTFYVLVFIVLMTGIAVSVYRVGGPSSLGDVPPAVETQRRLS
jgi:hypothetical protein